MASLLQLLLTALIVGVVTSGLKIRFDRFFAIILLIALMGLSVYSAINIFLWVLLLGAGYVLFVNRVKLRTLPSANKKKFISIIPLIAFTGAYFGTALLRDTEGAFLKVLFGIMALLYGLRLMFIHFKPHELEYKNEKPIYLKICGFFGPLVSGFTTGFLGTTLKQLKVPFAIRQGKMNMQQVYLGNTITAFYAALFAILFHIYYLPAGIAMTLRDFLLGVFLWAMIHVVFELSQGLFRENWRKPFQITIGAFLLVAAYHFILF